MSINYNNLKKSIKQALETDIIGATISVPSKIKGLKADIQRGNLLYKQGYGEYGEGALSIAKKGKTGGPKRIGASAVYR